MPILQVNDLKKTYTTRFGGQQVHALTKVNFSGRREATSRKSSSFRIAPWRADTPLTA